MSEFRPLNLAQIYSAADASVAQAMQTNLMVLQASRMKQDFDREDRLRELARTSTTVDETTGESKFDLKSFARGAYAIDPSKAAQIQKGVTEQRAAEVQIENTQGQVDERRMKMAAERLRLQHEASAAPFIKYQELVQKGVSDQDARKQVQPMFDTARQALIESGLFTEQQLKGAKIMQTRDFDPTVAETGMRQVLGAKEQIAQYWRERDFGEKEKANKETVRHNRATEGQAAAALSQSHEHHLENLRRQGQEVQQTEDGSWVVIDKNTKTAQPVRDPGTGEQLRSAKAGGTEGERISSGFANRMVAATGIIEELEKKHVGKPEWGEAILGKAPVVGKAAGNAAASEPRQKYRQAQEDWVRAKLRKESGAVIGDDEMDREIRTYFPQIGDGDAVIKQKAEARKRANEGMVQNAGKAYKAEAPKKEEPKAKAAAGAVSVSTPDGQTFSFPNQEAADKFKKAAGIQ